MPLARESGLHTSQNGHLKNNTECYRSNEKNFADSTDRRRKLKHVLQPEHNKNRGHMQAPRLMNVVKQCQLTPVWRSLMKEWG